MPLSAQLIAVTHVVVHGVPTVTVESVKLVTATFCWIVV
jgi:hypothetical protein